MVKYTEIIGGIDQYLENFEPDDSNEYRILTGMRSFLVDKDIDGFIEFMQQENEDGDEMAEILCELFAILQVQPRNYIQFPDWVDFSEQFLKE